MTQAYINVTYIAAIVFLIMVGLGVVLGVIGAISEYHKETKTEELETRNEELEKENEELRELVKKFKAHGCEVDEYGKERRNQDCRDYVYGKRDRD